MRRRERIEAFHETRMDLVWGGGSEESYIRLGFGVLGTRRWAGSRSAMGIKRAFHINRRRRRSGGEDERRGWVERTGRGEFTSTL